MVRFLLRYLLLPGFVILMGLLVLGCPRPDVDVPPAEVQVDMEAGNGYFDPDQITVEQGQTVRVSVENVGDIVHTFTIDEFNVHVSLEPGDQQEVSFTPAEAGNFEYYCAEPGHREGGMFGNLVVGEPPPLLNDIDDPDDDNDETPGY